jgi:two-component system, chemotaxis family, protein-glutamate methylesterase/glutaminase
MEATARSQAKETRVLIVDDSAFMRRAIARLITQEPGVVVVGEASNGLEGVQKALELRPHVITMDVEMPQLDGVSAVGEIMKSVPTPIVMVSTTTTAGAETTIRALEAGAVDCVPKPSANSLELQNVGERLCAAILRARDVQVRRSRPMLLRPPSLPPASKAPPSRGGVPARGIVVIGSSTGGPPALTAVIPHLPPDLAVGVLLIQHMPASFTTALARRLDALSAIHVREAVEGEPIVAGTVLVAPGDFHLTVGGDRHIHLNQAPTVHGVRPAVDVTLNSVASVYGNRATVAILTGMGRDGGAGCALVEQAGGHIIVQDEMTCTVWGMPRVAKELTKSAEELPIDRIAAAIARSVTQKVAG